MTILVSHQAVLPHFITKLRPWFSERCFLFNAAELRLIVPYLFNFTLGIFAILNRAISNAVLSLNEYVHRIALSQKYKQLAFLRTQPKLILIP